MKFLILQFPTVICYLLPRRRKYAPQYTIFQHPQSICFSKCGRWSFRQV